MNSILSAYLLLAIYASLGLWAANFEIYIPSTEIQAPLYSGAFAVLRSLSLDGSRLIGSLLVMRYQNLIHHNPTVTLQLHYADAQNKALTCHQISLEASNHFKAPVYISSSVVLHFLFILPPYALHEVAKAFIHVNLPFYGESVLFDVPFERKNDHFYEISKNCINVNDHKKPLRVEDVRLEGHGNALLVITLSFLRLTKILNCSATISNQKTIAKIEAKQIFDEKSGTLHIQFEYALSEEGRYSVDCISIKYISFDEKEAEFVESNCENGFVFYASLNKFQDLKWIPRSAHGYSKYVLSSYESPKLTAEFGKDVLWLDYIFESVYGCHYEQQSVQHTSHSLNLRISSSKSIDERYALRLSPDCSFRRITNIVNMLVSVINNPQNLLRLKLETAMQYSNDVILQQPIADNLNLFVDTLSAWHRTRTFSIDEYCHVILRLAFAIFYKSPMLFHAAYEIPLKTIEDLVIFEHVNIAGFTEIYAEIQQKKTALEAFYRIILQTLELVMLSARHFHTAITGEASQNEEACLHKTQFIDALSQKFYEGSGTLTFLRKPHIDAFVQNYHEILARKDGGVALGVILQSELENILLQRNHGSELYALFVGIAQNNFPKFFIIKQLDQSSSIKAWYDIGLLALDTYESYAASIVSRVMKVFGTGSIFHSDFDPNIHFEEFSVAALRRIFGNFFFAVEKLDISWDATMKKIATLMLAQACTRFSPHIQEIIAKSWK